MLGADGCRMGARLDVLPRCDAMSLWVLDKTCNPAAREDRKDRGTEGTEGTEGTTEETSGRPRGDLRYMKYHMKHTHKTTQKACSNLGAHSRIRAAQADQQRNLQSGTALCASVHSLWYSLHLSRCPFVWWCACSGMWGGRKDQREGNTKNDVLSTHTHAHTHKIYTHTHVHTRTHIPDVSWGPHFCCPKCQRARTTIWPSGQVLRLVWSCLWWYCRGSWSQ